MARSKLAAADSLPQYALIAVTWLDATFDLDREQPVETLTTVGYLIRQDSASICIAGEGNSKLDYFRSFTTIPAGMILAVRELWEVV